MNQLLNRPSFAAAVVAVGAILAVAFAVADLDEPQLPHMH